MEKTILIVDDSESIIEVVKFTLENNGFNVLPAINGKDALQYLDGRELALVLTDLHMPEMNGIELIKEIRTMEAYQSTPILFLTTESQADKKIEAKEAGATGWIVKPFAPPKLLAAIKKVVR
ncbi:MAG: response regulator [Bacteroidales bacterium]|nr:response regulator [Bacteroidales bacterium]